MKLLPFLALAMCALAADNIGVIEEIIAKVNGDIITRSELERSRKQLQQELGARSGLKGPALLKEVEDRSKDILRERVDQLLLVQKGKELSINVDPEVSKQIAEIQLRAKIADPEQFAQYVKEQTGQTLEDYKSEMRNSMVTGRVIRQEVGSRINVPRAELEKYYNEHKQDFVREERIFLRELLVSTQSKDDKGIAAAEKKAKDLSARAKKGEKFHELVRDNSEAESKENFGELGWFKRGDLNAQIADVVFAKERGFVSDPIRVSNGYLILKVEEKHRAGQASVEEVENEIMEKLYSPRYQPAVREYLTKLRQEAFLEIKDGFLDTGAAPDKSTKWTDPAQLKPETVTKEEVANQPRKKRFMGMVPIPGTKTTPKSSSK